MFKYVNKEKSQLQYMCTGSPLTFDPKIPAHEYSSQEHAKSCSPRCWLIRKIFSDLLSTACCWKKLNVN